MPLLDHVPPMLGCADFKAVAKHPIPGRMDKNYARSLLDFKPQADDALHWQISAKTDLLAIGDVPPESLGTQILQEGTS
jgi:hypothetical protein